MTAGRRAHRVAAPFATLVMAMVPLAACSDEAPSPEVAFPTVELVARGDASVDTGSWVGEPLVVNFWYSTCAPCARELKEFAAVDTDRDDVRFIGINPLDTPEKMTSFAGERGVDYELYRDELGELQTQLGITSFPATVFVAADGSVVNTTGVLDAERLHSEIDELLAGSNGDVTGTSEPDAKADGAELHGIRRRPAPQVDIEPLPSLTEPGGVVDLRSGPGRLQIVYFGFTNCPDVCPTTMADLSVALRRVGDRAEFVEVVMISVDPGRDRDHLADYVDAFVPGGVAAATDDLELLREIAEPFGADWEVRTLDDGTIEVDHTPFLYAVNADGELAVTWQFGTSSEHLADDIIRLLDESESTT